MAEEAAVGPEAEETVEEAKAEDAVIEEAQAAAAEAEVAEAEAESDEDSDADKS